MRTDRFDQYTARAWLGEAQRALHMAVPELTDLDAARGDADHGTNMDRGFTAIVEDLDTHQYASAGATLVAAGTVLGRVIGGTSGPLWAAALRKAGHTLGEQHPVEASSLAEALMGAAQAVAHLGGAVEGDNTMLDALMPAARTLTEAVADGTPLPAALAAAAGAARAGAEATATRAARKGRASYVGERGIGSPDPGAVSAAIVVEALHRAYAAEVDHPYP